MSTPRAVLFSDPNCPFCYALGERVGALGAWEQVEWRGAEHAPHLPVPMETSSAGFAAEIAREVEQVKALAPEVELTTPPGKPSTATAIRAGAAALAEDRGRGTEFVESLYRAFWTEGADLSDPDRLAELASAAGIEAPFVSATATASARDWQRQWEATGVGGVPLLIRDDGEPLIGLVETERLRDFLAD